MVSKERACDFCGTGDLAIGYLTDGARKYPGMRRWTRARLLICHSCYTAGFDPATGYTVLSTREKPRLRWDRLAGRGKPIDPAPCAACGQPVVRNNDPLLKRITCSAACDSSLSRRRNGASDNQGSGQPCAMCGAVITTGRADARYCGTACKQKAYRRRSPSTSRNATQRDTPDSPDTP